MSDRGAKPYVAAGCAGASALMMLFACGMAAMIRQYRELTVPLSLLSALAAVVMGVIAFRAFSAPPSSGGGS